MEKNALLTLINKKTVILLKNELYIYIYKGQFETYSVAHVRTHALVAGLPTKVETLEPNIGL